MIISLSVLLRVGNVSEKVVDEINALILSSVTFSKSLAIYEIMFKKYGRARQAT
jgi:hypothetical protein